MSTTAILALVLWTSLVGCLCFVIGAFHEYDRKGGSAELRRELRKMRDENQELMELIWLVNEETPSTPHSMPARALPTFTHSVERSRHLFTVRKNGGGA